MFTLVFLVENNDVINAKDRINLCSDLNDSFLNGQIITFLTTKQKQNAKPTWMCSDECYKLIDHNIVKKYRSSYMSLPNTEEKINFLKQFISKIEFPQFVNDKRRKFNYYFPTNFHIRVKICRKFFKYIFNINNYIIRTTLADIKIEEENCIV